MANGERLIGIGSASGSPLADRLRSKEIDHALAGTLSSPQERAMKAQAAEVERVSQQKLQERAVGDR